MLLDDPEIISYCYIYLASQFVCPFEKLAQV